MHVCKSDFISAHPLPVIQENHARYSDAGYPDPDLVLLDILISDNLAHFPGIWQDIRY